MRREETRPTDEEGAWKSMEEVREDFELDGLEDLLKRMKKQVNEMDRLRRIFMDLSGSAHPKTHFRRFKYGIEVLKDKSLTEEQLNKVIELLEELKEIPTLESYYMDPHSGYCERQLQYFRSRLSEKD